MRNRQKVAFVLRLLLFGLCGWVRGAVPELGPVVVIALENHSYSSVMGSTGTAAMPYLHLLISENTLAANFYATAPGSVPDYFMLTTGQQVSCCTSYAGPFTGNNLARVLIGGGKTWKAYVQGIPSTGYVGTGYYPYVKYHNPFAYFSDVLNSAAQKNRIVPLTQFGADLGSLPDFSFVVPDNWNNAHDCPNGVTNCTDADKMHAADLFLASYVPGLLATSQFQKNGLLVIWWDEGDSAGGERTAITLVGPAVKQGYVSGTLYKDGNLLRTIIEGLGQALFPGAAAAATDMGDIWTGSGGGSPPPTSGVTVSSPAAGATVPSPVNFVASATPTTGNVITAMRIYVDGVSAYTIQAATLNTSIAIAKGTHAIVVQAWDNTGAVYKNSFTITVS